MYTINKDSKLLKILCFLLIVPISLKAQTFPSDFEFGVSNASAQVEDDLNDAWMSFAKAGNTKAFLNETKPEKKLEFWTKPEVEINLASELGVKVFRMSIDWQRLVPTKSDKVLNLKALERYKEIIDLIKAKKMKVMLTLFHHSIPKWAQNMGGWSNPKVIGLFDGFARDVFDALNLKVDYWNTFNEPNVFAMFVHVAGIWPPGNGSFLHALNIPFFKGDFFKALDNMASSHTNFYFYTRNKNAKVGIAHNTAYYKEFGFLSSFAVNWSWENMNYYFPDKVKNHLDFMGINYYGSEYLTLGGVGFSTETEYNDAGRAFDPKGLYLILKDFYKRYKLPIYITENGTADEDDLFRSLYIAEHLYAILQAIKEGVPVKSYIYWSLSDNFEWSDGYCPKFGLASVDRKSMRRIPRESFNFFLKIVKSRKINQAQRDQLWSSYKSHIGKSRKMCRDQNGKDALDSPRKLKLGNADWRFK